METWRSVRRPGRFFMLRKNVRSVMEINEN